MPWCDCYDKTKKMLFRLSTYLHICSLRIAIAFEGCKRIYTALNFSFGFPITSGYIQMATNQKPAIEQAIVMFSRILATDADNVPALLGQSHAFMLLKQEPKVLLFFNFFFFPLLKISHSYDS
jgi:hypothetical protein